MSGADDIYSIDALTKASKYISALMLALMATYGFFTRYLGAMSNIVDLVMIAVSLVVVVYLVRNMQSISVLHGDVLLISLLLSMALVLSVLLHPKLNALVQYVLLMAYLVPLILIDCISTEVAYRYFLKLLAVIAVIQFPFDLLFPRLELAHEDAYSGTFLIANDKSRYLFLLLLASSLFIKRYKHASKLVMLIPVPFVVVSFFWGDSLFTYAFGALSVLVGLTHKKKYLGVFIFFAGASAVAALVIRFAELPVIYIQYNRYLDLDHGVLAAIVYAVKTLISTGFLGTGLGEFASRTSQSLGGTYLSSIPRAMVNFGEIADKNVATGGFPWYLSLIAETGILGMLVSMLLIRYLYRRSHKSAVGYMLFIYVLLLSFYSPIFFEKPDGILFLYSYLLLSKALHYHDETLATVTSSGGAA
jgi:hypothetical protein